MFLRDEFREIGLDIFGRPSIGQPEPLRKPRYVRINDHTRRDPKSIPQNNIRRLEGNASERQEVFHRLRDLAAIRLQKPLARRFYILRLVAEKSGRVDLFFELRLGKLDEMFRCRVLPEKLGGDYIYALVRALSRQDRGDQKLKGICVVERAMRVRIGLFKAFYNLFCLCGSIRNHLSQIKDRPATMQIKRALDII